MDEIQAGKRQIARAAGLVMALFVISRALGLVREMVISHQFGTSAELDAYLAAFRLPDILFQLVAGGALVSAFLPTFTGFLAQDDRQGAWRLASAVVNLVLLVTTALSLLAIALAQPLVTGIIAPGFDPAQQALTVQLMRAMLVTPIIFGASGVVMGILNAHQHFLLPALAPIVYNLGIIGGALLLAPRAGVQGLVAGVVVGAVWHLAVQVPGLWRFGARWRAVLGLRDKSVHEVGRLMLPRMLGLAAVQLNFLVNTILASGLATGSLAALNYAWLLMLLPQGVFAQAVATAAFPTFSTQVARGQLEAMRDTLSSALRAVLYLAVPAAVGLFVLRKPLVAILFQRGEFTVQSTELVAWALLFYALGLPGHAGVEIVARAFYALHDTKTPVLVGMGAMLGNVVLSLSLIAVFRAAGLPPHGGLALANSTATLVEVAVLVALIRRRLGGLDGRRLGVSLARTVVSALTMGAVVAGLLFLLQDRNAWLVGLAGVVVGGLDYLATSVALGASEPQAVLGMVLRRG
jgi:putative peptidoglycan lipid II flippase